MSKIFADRVKERTTITGTGVYALDGTEPGFRTFADAIGDTNTVDYCITDGIDWEVGTGTVTVGTPSSISRDTIHASSNSNLAVDWGQGNKTIFSVISANKINGIDAAISDHIADISNPHDVTASQVGLGNVKNVDTTIAGNINIADTGGNFTATNVEDALAELAGQSGVQYFTESRSSSGVNSTVPVHAWEVSGAETDIDVALVPKGTGAITAAVADGTDVGGDKRGTYAVDLQINRGFNNRVAGGNYAVLIGGYYNQAQGERAVCVGGGSNFSSGTGSVVVGGSANYSTGASSFLGGGYSNNARGDYSVSVGGSFNDADGNYSTIPGGHYAITRGIYGRFAYASGSFSSTKGQAQACTDILRFRTLNESPSILTTDNQSPVSGTDSNVTVIPDDHAYKVNAKVTAFSPSSGDTKEWEISALVVRGTGAGSVAFVGTPTVTSSYASTGSSAWICDIVVNTTRGSVEVEATGEASTTIHWVCELNTVEVG